MKYQSKYILLGNDVFFCSSTCPFGTWGKTALPFFWSKGRYAKYKVFVELLIDTMTHWFFKKIWITCIMVFVNAMQIVMDITIIKNNDTMTFNWD